MRFMLYVAVVIALSFATQCLAQDMCSTSFFKEKRTDAYAGKMMMQVGENWEDVSSGGLISNHDVALTKNFCIWVPQSSDSGTDVLYVHVSRSRPNVMLYNNILDKNIVKDFIKWCRKFFSKDFTHDSPGKKLFPMINKAEFEHFHCKTRCLSEFYATDRTGVAPELYLWHQQMENASCSPIWAIWCGDRKMNIPLESEFMFKLEPTRDAPSWIPLELDIYRGETANIITLFSGNNAPSCTHSITRK